MICTLWFSPLLLVQSVDGGRSAILASSLQFDQVFFPYCAVKLRLVSYLPYLVHARTTLVVVICNRTGMEWNNFLIQFSKSHSILLCLSSNFPPSLFLLLPSPFSSFLLYFNSTIFSLSPYSLSFPSSPSLFHSLHPNSPCLSLTLSRCHKFFWGP